MTAGQAVWEVILALEAMEARPVGSVEIQDMAATADQAAWEVTPALEAMEARPAGWVATLALETMEVIVDQAV